MQDRKASGGEMNQLPTNQMSAAFRISYSELLDDAVHQYMIFNVFISIRHQGTSLIYKQTNFKTYGISVMRKNQA